jgi:hypothetical protein
VVYWLLHQRNNLAGAKANKPLPQGEWGIDRNRDFTPDVSRRTPLLNSPRHFPQIISLHDFLNAASQKTRATPE